MKAEKNALLAIARLKPGLWDCLEEEDVLGALRFEMLTNGMVLIVTLWMKLR